MFCDISKKEQTKLCIFPVFLCNISKHMKDNVKFVSISNISTLRNLRRTVTNKKCKNLYITRIITEGKEK